MEELSRYALCVETADRQLIPVISGNVNARRLYRLVMEVSSMRQTFPQFQLVVAGHIVRFADLTAEGMALKGVPIDEASS